MGKLEMNLIFRVIHRQCPFFVPEMPETMSQIPAYLITNSDFREFWEFLE